MSFTFSPDIRSLSIPPGRLPKIALGPACESFPRRGHRRDSPAQLFATQRRAYAAALRVLASRAEYWHGARSLPDSARDRRSHRRRARSAVASGTRPDGDRRDDPDRAGRFAHRRPLLVVRAPPPRRRAHSVSAVLAASAVD